MCFILSPAIAEFPASYLFKFLDLMQNMTKSFDVFRLRRNPQNYLLNPCPPVGNPLFFTLFFHGHEFPSLHAALKVTSVTSGGQRNRKGSPTVPIPRFV